MMDGELQWVYVLVGLVVVVSVVIPAIVQGLAQRIASGDVPKTLMGKRTRTARGTMTGHAVMAQQATHHETGTDPLSPVSARSPPWSARSSFSSPDCFIPAPALRTTSPPPLPNTRGAHTGWRFI